MAFEHIKNLLDRYFAGETSLEDEQQLREYFSSDEVDPKLDVFKPLFRVLARDRDLRAPKGLKNPAAKRRYIGRPLWQGLAIAATLAGVVFFSGVFSKDQNTEPATAATGIDWSQYEVNDPEQALALTKEALQYTSTQLQEATQSAMQGLGEVKQMGSAFQ